MFTFKFGGAGGDSTRGIGDVGGSVISFRAGIVIDSITINNTTYGGSGGDNGGSFTLPADGRLYLTELQVSYIHSHCVISFMSGSINNTAFSVGTQNADPFLKFSSSDSKGIAVKFHSIAFGAYVDSIEFEVIALK